MFKYYFLLLLIFLFSCTSPYGNGGIKFSNRVGIYKDDAQTITVIISDKSKDNLNMAITSPESINEIISINSSSTSQYLKINSVKYKGYIYILNLGNNVKNIFFTVRNDKDQTIIFNEKLTIQK